MGDRGDYLVALLSSDDPGDTSWMGAGELAQVESGELVQYGVGLLRVTDEGRFEPDYSTFVWECWAGPDMYGSYSSPDAIPDEYLADIAREQVKGFGDA